MQSADGVAAGAMMAPVGSVLPQRDASIDVGAASAAVRGVAELVESGVSTAPAMREAMTALGAALAGMMDAPPLVMETAAARAVENAAFLAASPHPPSADDLDNYVIYDRYFGVQRTAAMSAQTFLAGMLAVWARAFPDCAQALIGRDEIGALLHACAAMLALRGNDATAAAPQSHLRTFAVSSDPFSGLDERGRGLLRWRTGHDLFALCSMHAREAYVAVQQTLAAKPADAADRIAQALTQAGTFVRGLAAAQWYASEFPIAFYLDVLRPTMIATGAHGGFSGTQNADHHRMQWERERAVEGLFSAYGADPAGWPQPVYSALMLMNEIEIQAAEHHVLVAASKVRLDQSLAQKAIAGDRSSAVAVLREQVDAAATDITERFSSHATRRIRACGIGDVPAEHPLQLTLDGNDIVLCRAYGALWACAGVCTHAGGDLGDGHMADNAIVCPLHGAKFDPRTGAVLRGPAAEPLATYTVLIDGADVFVELP
ncbi:MAG TPA: Rieske 2Fe-2S domain-containing protein [Candidatus Dormibacteraeota bacterium]|nr:Rieske 2Fe-2S domain-containing protein [Candidatus Dormibacteraeota bacterium]